MKVGCGRTDNEGNHGGAVSSGGLETLDELLDLPYLDLRSFGQQCRALILFIFLVFFLLLVSLPSPLCENDGLSSRLDAGHPWAFSRRGISRARGGTTTTATAHKSRYRGAAHVLLGFTG